LNFSTSSTKKIKPTLDLKIVSFFFKKEKV